MPSTLKKHCSGISIDVWHVACKMSGEHPSLKMDGTKQ